MPVDYLLRLFLVLTLLPAASAGFASVAQAAAGESSAGPVDRSWVEAVGRNDMARLREQLEPGTSGSLPIDTPTDTGKTALMAAAAAGDPVVFERLLAAGADPAARNAKGASVLMYAAWRGNQQIVNRLIGTGVPLEPAAGNGWTAVTMAVAKGHRQALAALLAAGAQVDPRDVQGWTPLMRACNLGRAGTATLLIERGGADLSLTNTRGQTPLHLAVAAGQREIIAALLTAGADPEVADFHGLTPAAMAASRGLDLRALR